MIQVKANGSKRATICGVDYVFNHDATVKDYPLQDLIVIVPSWTPIKYSSVSFSQSDDNNGEMIIQELSITLKGMDPEAEKELNTITGKGVLVRLKYSNGLYKVVGTEDNPVIFSQKVDSSPTSLMIISKRLSAEKAKYLHL